MHGQLDRPVLNPSHAHEERRQGLETIAMAAGYRLEMRFPGGKRPDVLRLHTQGSSVFLGEAKHTEGPSDLHSVDRLRHYLDWLVGFSRRKGRIVLAVAHARGLGDRWRDRVAWLCEEVCIEGAVESRVLTRTTTVTYLASDSGGSCCVPRGIGRARHSRHSVVSEHGTWRGRGRQH